MATELVEDFLSFAHNELTLNPFCQHYSDFIYSTSVLFFFITKRCVLLALVFYYKDMLEK